VAAATLASDRARRVGLGTAVSRSLLHIVAIDKRQQRGASRKFAVTLQNSRSHEVLATPKAILRRNDNDHRARTST
jgi:hypothetical protein